MTIEQHEPEVHAPAIGDQGEPCKTCAAPLAADQRYCLNCGERRAGMRVRFMEILEQRLAHAALAEETSAPAPTAPIPAERQRIPAIAWAAGGVGLFVLVLGLGVLIGSLGDDNGGKTAPPQVISVGAAPAATAEQPFVSDWPEGQDGYTIQLQTLPKAGTQVTAVTQAKTDVTNKGATEVGALDSDQFSSLDPGNYVIYSGVFETKKEAQKALKDVKKSFPDAEVVKVSAAGGLAEQGDPDALSGKKEATVGKKQLQELQNLSPEEYQKKSQKLPDTTKLPGKAPPKDNKKPGGSDQDTQVIK